MVHRAPQVGTDPFTAAAVAVSQGKTDSQFSIPDGKYIGDLFFITDTKNQILIAFMWTGAGWIHEHQVFEIQDSPQKTPPSGLKHIKVDSSADEIAITDQFRPQWTTCMIRSYLAQGGTMQTRYGQPEVITDPSEPSIPDTVILREFLRRHKEMTELADRVEKVLTRFCQ